MKSFLLFFAACLMGSAGGAATALMAAGMAGSSLNISQAVRAGQWTSDWSIGSEAANPWTRARVARHGLLALRKEEAVYFTTNTDSDGRRLHETCSYEVSGSRMPGSWWSVTLYDATSYLPRNTDNALSFDRTKAEALGMHEEWRFTISSDLPDRSAGISSRAGGAFDLTLRIYKPSEAFLADPETILQPPLVRRLACSEGN